MFCDNLSASLTSICAACNLSQREAAEQCDLAPCCFGRIIRKQSVPSLDALEKICIGLARTPNELLGLANIHQGFVYRLPMRVTAVRLHMDTSFPICPRCGSTLDREYQAYCDCCGQYLSWERYGADVIVVSEL